MFRAVFEDWLSDLSFLFSNSEEIVTTVLRMAIAAGLSAPVVLLGVSSARAARLYWLILFPLCLALTGVEGALIGDVLDEDFYLEVFGAAAVVLMLYMGLGRRRARNVVPVLFVGAWLLVSAWCVVFLGLKVFAPCVPGGIMQKPLLYVLPLLLFWPLQRVAFGTLGWVARAYERKVFSDAQFQAMVWMLTFPICIAFTLTNAEDGGPLDAQSFGVFPAVIVGAGVYIYLSKRIRPWPYPIQLLLLRVFASDPRGEQLLDEVAFRWRFFGPIRMIGGPDLAQSNLAPHKLLRFLRRQLVEQFISDRQTLLAHIAALDERPDPDAPYRINEFFCFDNTWQDAVAHLLERSDAVLLDLRGFTKARRGTAVEIALLAQRGALDRTVFLIDHETDRDAVAHALAEVPGASMPERHILQMDGKLQGADIFKALVSAAGGPRHGRPKDL